MLSAQAEEVAMQAQTTRRVIVGVNDTLAGYQAVRYAVAQARERGVPLVAARAFRCSGPTAPWRDALVEANTEYVKRVFAVALGGFPADVRADIAVRDDDVVKALVKIADRGDDLLVIGGTERRRWFHRRGRIMRRCSREAGCPIMIVPPPAMAGHSFSRLAKNMVREADQLLAAPATSAATLPPRPGSERL
jgi:nucleotide-binding universal stress UspA family protein